MTHIQAVELFVAGAAFDHQHHTMSAVQSVLRMGLRCAIVDYVTKDVMGHFIATHDNPWGYEWLPLTWDDLATKRG